MNLKSGAGKFLLIMVLGIPLSSGPGLASNLDTAQTENRVQMLPAADAPNGAEAPDEMAKTRQKKRSLTGFWVIGLLINVVVMSAFVVWAVGQWRKTGR